ncbi:hypothetical protein [Janibacter alittae]|uniref:C2H2-type domain-containing protein n=1 Tax=Janibacter alittae TaxID=3115209 RepID=A0ABZ2MLG2_9MICO
MIDGPGLSALAPVWVEALEHEGVASRVHLALWLDEHRESPEASDVDALVRRVRDGVRLVDLATEKGWTAHSQVQAWLHRTAFRLIVPHLENVGAWHQARQTGVPDVEIGQLSGTLPEVVALALDGWQAVRSGAFNETKALEAHRRWCAGGSRAEVAGVLGIAAQRLNRQLNTGESQLLPRRLTTTGLRARFGWTPSAVSLYRSKGVLPLADGRDGQRDWWWEPTIEAWEQTAGLSWCEDCHHAFVSPTGLREHCTRVHG